MKGEWSLYHKRWSKEFCESILERSKKYPFDSAQIGVGTTSIINEESRRSKIKFIPATDESFKDVFNDLWLSAVETNNIFYNFHISKLDFFQLTEYSSEYQGEYKKHQDVFWLNNDPIYHRKLSCVVQLSDPADYVGGDLVFEDLQLEYPNQNSVKDQGTLIYFPSFIQHAVTPVISGTRYSLVGWFDGPKWR